MAGDEEIPEKGSGYKKEIPLSLLSLKSGDLMQLLQEMERESPGGAPGDAAGSPAVGALAAGSLGPQDSYYGMFSEGGGHGSFTKLLDAGGSVSKLLSLKSSDIVHLLRSPSKLTPPSSPGRVGGAAAGVQITDGEVEDFNRRLKKSLSKSLSILKSGDLMNWVLNLDEASLDTLMADVPSGVPGGLLNEPANSPAPELAANQMTKQKAPKPPVEGVKGSKEEDLDPISSAHLQELIELHADKPLALQQLALMLQHQAVLAKQALEGANAQRQPIPTPEKNSTEGKQKGNVRSAAEIYQKIMVEKKHTPSIGPFAPKSHPYGAQKGYFGMDRELELRHVEPCEGLIVPTMASDLNASADQSNSEDLMQPWLSSSAPLRCDENESNKGLVGGLALALSNKHHSSRILTHCEVSHQEDLRRKRVDYDPNDPESVKRFQKDEDRRDRNRKSAAKSRAKKREYTAVLEAHVKRLEEKESKLKNNVEFAMGTGTADNEDCNLHRKRQRLLNHYISLPKNFKVDL